MRKLTEISAVEEEAIECVPTRSFTGLNESDKKISELLFGETDAVFEMAIIEVN